MGGPYECPGFARPVLPDPTAPRVDRVGTVGVAASLFWLVTSSEIEIDIGWLKLKKKGLGSREQVELGKEVIPALFSASPGGVP